MITLRGPNGNREIPENTPYRKLPGEYVLRGTGSKNKLFRADDQIDNLAQANEVGVGDLIEAITTSTGFKKWWDAKHGGECKSCQRNKAVLNYIQGQVPGWLSSWVKDTIKK